MRAAIGMLSPMAWGTGNCSLLRCMLCSLALVACGGETHSVPSEGGLAGPGATDAAEGTKDGIATESGTASTEGGGNISDTTATAGMDGAVEGAGETRLDDLDTGATPSAPAEGGTTNGGEAGAPEHSCLDSKGEDAGNSSSEAGPQKRVDAVPQWGATGVPEGWETVFTFEFASYSMDRCTIQLQGAGATTLKLRAVCADDGEEARACWCGFGDFGTLDTIFELERFPGMGLVPCVHAMEDCGVRL